LTIPVIILTSYYIVYLLKKKGFYKILAFLALILIISTSLFNINNLYQGKLEWEGSVRPWQAYLEKVPENGTIISDFIGIPRLYRPDLKIYFLRDSQYEGIFLDMYGENGKNEIDKDIISREENKLLFKNYIKKYIITNYILSENQMYYYADGTPKVMSVEHLRGIVQNSNNQTVYLILTHNAYDRNNQIQNPDLYKFILENSIVMEEKFETKMPFDNRHVI